MKEVKTLSKEMTFSESRNSVAKKLAFHA